MITYSVKKGTMIFYILILVLLTGCGKTESSGDNAAVLKIEDIPAKELPEEDAHRPQGAATNQTGTPVAEEEPQQEIKTDQAKTPVAEEKETQSARLQKYQEVLTDILEKHIYPDGTECAVDGAPSSGNKFAVFDVDKDGKEELILCITAAPTAGMREVVYDYDEKADTVWEEYSGFPGAAYYENGLIEESLSHNQGMAPLGDFWPYMLHRYQAESDSYLCIFTVDAWEKAFREQDYDGNPYPEETDAEKSGIVYFLMEGSEYNMSSTVPVSKSTYEEWRREQGLGSERIEIPFQALTSENADSL
ncbi:MAG: hypothetical protein K2O15_01245 [Lachnospiraceae bacterium]|nr:hypothetical protein [Lachnospiraceae bacterium]